MVDDSTTYGGPLADKVKSELGDLVVDSDKIQEKQTDFATDGLEDQGRRARTPSSTRGYAAEAGPFLKQLRAAGYQGNRSSVATASTAPTSRRRPASRPRARSSPARACPAEEAEGTFAEDFEAEYGATPGAYAAEGFDAMNIFLDGPQGRQQHPRGPAEVRHGLRRPGITKDDQVRREGRRRGGQGRDLGLQDRGRHARRPTQEIPKE